jgi:putative hydrolase of the HAD superfamily
MFFGARGSTGAAPSQESTQLAESRNTLTGMEHDSVRNVVFDAVGTLIYPDPAVAAIYALVGRRFGSKRTECEILQRFRAVFAELEARDQVGDLSTSDQHEQSRWQEIVRRVLDDVADSTACFSDLFTHFARPQSWRLYPEVATTLAKLSSHGISLAIASNFDNRLFDIVRQIGPLAHCQPVLVSSQIGYRNPHRRFFEAIASAVAAKPGDVLYIGDEAQNDVAGARAVGMQARLLRRSGRADAGTLTSLAELIPLLGLD